MTDETMKTFEKIPHVTSAYPDLEPECDYASGAYEKTCSCMISGAMKNI